MPENLLDLLKQKRRQIANREGRELFQIFHNVVLERTAEAKPKTKEDLKNIKGWGERKIKTYGDEILEIINGNEQKAEIIKSTKILSVSELISFINSHLSTLGNLNVRGEITEVSIQSNAFGFFTIKDSQTEDHSIGCFIGRQSLGRFGYLLEPGMEVVVSAMPSLYKSGRFNLIINKVEPYGEGALQKAFEALKKKLETQGYFDPSRKRPIPEFIKKIGLITSESSAAIRDFRTNLGEYGFKIYLQDVRVEGDYAEQSIISAMQCFNKNRPDLDVLVLLRGGGSLENLKAFNSEGIADAIATSRLPIITGIGHERDETIADYVADKRCSTPTAAAVFIRTQRETLIGQTEECLRNLVSAMEDIIEEQNRIVVNQTTSLRSAFTYIIDRYKLVIARVTGQMQAGLSRIFDGFQVLERSFVGIMHQYESSVSDQVHAADMMAQQCLHLLDKKYNADQNRLKIAQTALVSLNPEAVLKRGYSIAYGADNKVLKESIDIEPGDTMHVRLYKGKVTSLVEKVEK